MQHFFNGKSYIKLIVLSLSLIVSVLEAQNLPKFKFHSDGKFKIVQFTDIHLKIEKQARCDSVLTIMTDVLKREKPDLVVLTGDICTSEKVKETWTAVSTPMVKAGIPWAVVFGNHDHEHQFTNRQLMDYIVTLPLSISQNGPENIHGSGNYPIEIYGSKENKLQAVLYCMDSNDYTWDKKNKELGEYDWIRFDQIKWYRELSKSYTTNNNNNPLSAMAFFHIPLPEFELVQKFKNTIGDREENVSSPAINSGMYNAFLESKDVMAVFCGHDHNNNFIGTLNNIALVYGCKTGKDAYGKLDKGGRVIVLHEGERKFDTWITTTKDDQKYFVTYPDNFNK
jgi:Icc-related predicted phosphoesterase